MRKLIKNKKGWIKIVEAFIAIAFIIGVLTVFGFSNRDAIEDKTSSRVNEIQSNILHLIQVDDDLRNDIVQVTPDLESTEGGYPSGINSLIDSQIPPNLICQSKICAADQDCQLDSYEPRTEIYIKNTIISSSQNVYNPLKLSLFCWKD